MKNASLLLFALLGFLIHVLWVVALILAVGWLFGFAFRRSPVESLVAPLVNANRARSFGMPHRARPPSRDSTLSTQMSVIVTLGRGPSRISTAASSSL